MTCLVNSWSRPFHSPTTHPSYPLLSIIAPEVASYKGQAMTLTVDFTDDDLKDTTQLLKSLRQKFGVMHEQQFGFSLETAELEREATSGFAGHIHKCFLLGQDYQSQEIIQLILP